MGKSDPAIAKACVGAYRPRAPQATMGDFAGAEQDLRDAFEKDTTEGLSLSVLFRGRKVTSADQSLIESAEKALPKAHPRSQRELHYALGKAYHDLGEFERAMSHYNSANKLSAALTFEQTPTQLTDVQRVCELYKQIFTRSAIEALSKNGNKDETPIFIVGRIRSGTTLVEQILSSHKAVTGAGELHYWSNNGNAAIDFQQLKVNGSSLQLWAADYLQLIKSIGPDSKRVIDKFPGNLLMAPLIHCALPNARFVCVHRSPIDVALSMWMTPMTTDAAFMHDKAQLVESIKLHHQMMLHWQRLLPTDRFKVFKYEKVITDREATTRAMVDFLGLEWDDACLHPEANKREVLTPSMWQVRQAVYPSSIDRWKPYEPWLGEFAELIGAESDVSD